MAPAGWQLLVASRFLVSHCWREEAAPEPAPAPQLCLGLVGGGTASRSEGFPEEMSPLGGRQVEVLLGSQQAGPSPTCPPVSSRQSSPHGRFHFKPSKRKLEATRPRSRLPVAVATGGDKVL